MDKRAAQQPDAVAEIYVAAILAEVAVDVAPAIAHLEGVRDVVAIEVLPAAADQPAPLSERWWAGAVAYAAARNPSAKILFIAFLLMTSPEELRVGVASVDSDVARGAVPIPRVGHVVRRRLRRDAAACAAESARRRCGIRDRR